MPTGDRIYIADKETLDSVNTKVGAVDDAVGTSTTGSLMAKLNKLISDVTGLATNWTSARATKVDNLDATVSSRAPSSTALSTATWTSTRAGYLDKINTNLDAKVSTVNTAIGTSADTASTSGTTLFALLKSAVSTSNSAKSNTATNNTASSTGVLSQKLSYIISTPTYASPVTSSFNGGTIAKDASASGTGKGILTLKHGYTTSSSSTTVVIDGKTKKVSNGILGAGVSFPFSSSWSVTNDCGSTVDCVYCVQYFS